MDNATFEGFRNYDTFAVAFWLDNTPRHYQMSRAMANSIQSTVLFAQWLGEYAKDEMPAQTPVVDMANVDWLEIAGELQKEF